MAILEKKKTMWNKIVQIAPVITAILTVIIAVATFFYTLNKDSNNIKFMQANSISAWIETDESGNTKEVQMPSYNGQTTYMRVIINNPSEQPVYNTTLSSGSFQGAGAPFLTGDGATSSIGVLPPGKYTTLVPYPGVSMGIRLAAVISFTDTRGISWLRDANGHLQEIKRPEYTLKVTLPPGNWQALQKYSEKN